MFQQKRRIFCLVLALALMMGLPFAVPSPFMLENERTRLEEEAETGLLTHLIPSATAEEAKFSPLPIDFTGGPQPNPKHYREDGYEDQSIKVKLESRTEDGLIWRIVDIQLTDPSQLRTATAGGVKSSRVAYISSMAKKYNAVIAISANYLSNDPKKTSFEYRMGEKVRAKINKLKDMLFIDENGDFHLFYGPDKKQQVDAFHKAGHKIINAFTFGPALVVDGKVMTIDKKYDYNNARKEPRLGIGQIGPLHYVIVLAEGRITDSHGCTQQTLADFMGSLGCQQAFNLDGGNSATIVYDGGYFQTRTKKSERAQSDMIYFSTLVPESQWD